MCQNTIELTWYCSLTRVTFIVFVCLFFFRFLFVCFLAPENNPGWYLPEDDGTGGVAIQRRNMPLLKDNSSLFMLNLKAKVRYHVLAMEIFIRS